MQYPMVIVLFPKFKSYQSGYQAQCRLAPFHTKVSTSDGLNLLYLIHQDPSLKYQRFSKKRKIKKLEYEASFHCIY